jgi:hypothetical protein
MIFYILWNVHWNASVVCIRSEDSSDCWNTLEKVNSYSSMNTQKVVLRKERTQSLKNNVLCNKYRDFPLNFWREMLIYFDAVYPHMESNLDSRLARCPFAVPAELSPLLIEFHVFKTNENQVHWDINNNKEYVFHTCARQLYTLFNYISGTNAISNTTWH